MSRRWTGVAVLVVSLSVIWLVFMLYGSPWLGLTWVVSLAFIAALWANRQATLSGHSIGQVLSGLESEPVAVTPIPADPPAPKPIL